MQAKIMVGILASVAAVALSGCSWMGAFKRTPMQPQEVAQLTTCATGDMAQIKKNLLLAGYSVPRVDQETVETDFKQMGGAGHAKAFVRITAVRIDDTTTKFKVRVKLESLDSVKTGELKDGNGRTIATDSSLVKNQNEEDEAYFVEGRNEYAQVRSEVCGAAVGTTGP